MASQASQQELEMKQQLVNSDVEAQEKDVYATYPTIIQRDGITWKQIAIVTCVLALAFGIFFGGYAAGMARNKAPSTEPEYVHSAYQFSIGTETFVTKPFVGSMPVQDFLQCRSVLIRGTITCMPTNPLLTPKDTTQFFLYQYKNDVSLIMTMTGPQYGNVVDEAFVDLGNYTLNAAVSVNARIIPMGDEYARRLNQKVLDGDYSVHVEAENNGCDGITFLWEDDGLTDSTFYFSDVTLSDMPDVHVMGEEFMPRVFQSGLPTINQPLKVSAYDGEYVPPPQPTFQFTSSLTGLRSRRSVDDGDHDRRRFGFSANFGFDFGPVKTNFGFSFRRSAEDQSQKQLTGEELGVGIVNYLDDGATPSTVVNMMVDSTSNNEGFTWVFHVRDVINNRNFSLNYFTFDGVYDGIHDEPQGGNQLTLEIDSANSTGRYSGATQALPSIKTVQSLGGNAAIEQWVIDAVDEYLDKVAKLAGTDRNGLSRRGAISDVCNSLDRLFDAPDSCACDTIGMTMGAAGCLSGIFASAAAPNPVSIAMTITSCGLTTRSACGYFSRCVGVSLPGWLC